jgi:YidC/Oxa1 family membrane protein insertase
LNFPIWSQFVQLIETGLVFINTAIGDHPALAIIIFTILIKVAMLPLTMKQLNSSKRMQELQPQIKELQKKYAKDKQKLTQETMALYREHNASPTSGCLPMLVQWPVFFGLYSAILNLSNTVFNVPFLWLPSLAHPDPYFILAILAGAAQFVQQRMMMPAGGKKNQDSTQAATNTMMQFMPLMIVVFAWQFASGAVLYWIVSSVFGIVQQYFVTGWGSLIDLLPFLPEPKHQAESAVFASKKARAQGTPKSLAAPKSETIEADEGTPVAPVRPRGLMGWMERMAAMQNPNTQANISSDGDEPPGDEVTTPSEETEEGEEALASVYKQTGQKPRKSNPRKGGARRGKRKANS